jgi:hypothetical protein
VFPVGYELYLCVPYGSQNKQRLFPQTALEGLTLKWSHNLFPVRYKLGIFVYGVAPVACFGVRICKAGRMMTALKEGAMRSNVLEIRREARLLFEIPPPRLVFSSERLVIEYWFVCGGTGCYTNMRPTVKMWT